MVCSSSGAVGAGDYGVLGLCWQSLGLLADASAHRSGCCNSLVQALRLSNRCHGKVSIPWRCQLGRLGAMLVKPVRWNRSAAWVESCFGRQADFPLQLDVNVRLRKAGSSLTVLCRVTKLVGDSFPVFGRLDRRGWIACPEYLIPDARRVFKCFAVNSIII
jgi:hypothetical protein